MTGDPMLAYPLTYTGSIGIVYGRPNCKGLYDKLGITKDIMTRGQNAAIDTDYGPMSEVAKVKLHEVLQQFYTGLRRQGRRQPADDLRRSSSPSPRAASGSDRRPRQIT